MSIDNNQPDHKKENLLISFLKLLTIPLILILAFPFIIPNIVRGIYLRFKFCMVAAKLGKNILFVYSDSTNWKLYIETNILPRIQDKAIILNWSERSQWDNSSWEVRTFLHWGGYRDFNPVAIVYCNFFKIRVISFHKAFLDYKHEKIETLQKVESKFFQLINIEKS